MLIKKNLYSLVKVIPSGLVAAETYNKFPPNNVNMQVLYVSFTCTEFEIMSFHMNTKSAFIIHASGNSSGS